MSKTLYLIPCAGDLASLLVTATTMTTSAIQPLEIHILEPLRIQLEPSLRAKVLIPWRSL